MLTFLTSWYDTCFMFFTITAPDFLSDRPKSTSHLAKPRQVKSDVSDENTYCTRLLGAPGTELRNQADELIQKVWN